MNVTTTMIAFCCVLFLVTGASQADTAGRLMLASGKFSEYKIVISKSATDMEKKAAGELQTYIQKMSGVVLPITSDENPSGSKEIIIGRGSRLSLLNVHIDWKKLGDDGFTIRTVGESLVIVGGPVNGTLYGVYSFLDDYLGCKWLSGSVNVIPKRKFVRINPVNDIQVPVLSYREVYYYEAMDPDFAARQKLNGNYSICTGGHTVNERHRGWGTWCHSFFTFVPPEKYFASHPEYYGLVDGKRQAQQLCLSNPDVLRITVEEMKRRMAADPNISIWDVSQMDWGGWCTCPECKAIDDREGTPMGSILTFVNKVAAQIPDKTISTLAYAYSVKPPKTVRPISNVHIMLCNIGCSRSQSLGIDPRNADFRNDIQNWSKICNKIDVWDYVIQFANLESPFPNLRVLQPNMQFLVKNHAKGVFSQGNREAIGEFANLRVYMLAKLSWNPNCDINKVMNEFLTGYYGKAAKPIRQYIDIMHDALAKSGAGLYIFEGPKNAGGSYLTPELMTKYRALFDEAEKLVADQPDVLLRVKTARMPIQYAQLELEYGTRAERESIAKSLFETAAQSGLKQFTEWGVPVEQYKDRLQASGFGLQEGKG